MNQRSFDFTEERKVYTVTELNRLIKGVLDRAVGEVWISGEVSRPTYHSSGHVYFSLKDESSQLRAVCFRREASRLKFELEQGMEVLAFGKIGVYEPRGEYQIVVREMEPKGVGSLQLAFEQLKKKLAEEGLFDHEHKKELPFFPRLIGVVTSPTGAAIRDVLNVINRRFPNVRVVLYPVKVQGDGAAEEIAQAVMDFSSSRVPVVPDVLIVGRGGGSIEDLWPFNEEVVARAVFECPIPVVSAVGHEIDFSICDFVADVRAATPSAAAEIVVPRYVDLDAILKNNYRRASLALKTRLKNLKMEVLKVRDNYVFRNPLEMVRQKSQAADDLGRTLTLSIKGLVALTRERLKAASGKIESLSPLGVLSRGYSVTARTADGSLVRDVSDVRAGDVIKTRLRCGAINSVVEDTEVFRDVEKEEKEL